VRQQWEPEDLIEVWTLLEDDMMKLRNSRRRPAIADLDCEPDHVTAHLRYSPDDADHAPRHPGHSAAPVRHHDELR
jgi:hypothetical protein